MSETTERTITEFSQSYRASDRHDFEDAYDMANAVLYFYIVISLITGILSWLLRSWGRAIAQEHSVNVLNWNDYHVLGWIALWCVIGWLLYHGVLGYMKATARREIRKQGRQKRVIEERVISDGDTSSLEFDANSGWNVKGTFIERHEKGFRLGDLHLSGRNMRVIRTLAKSGKLDRLRRDPHPTDKTLFSWNRDLPDLPATESDKRDFYSAWLNALHGEGLADKHSGKFTEKGVVEFLGLTPPPRNDNNE